MFTSETLADYIVSLDPRDFGQDLLARIRDLLLDGLGAAAAGFATPSAAAIRAVSRATFQGGSAPIWFSGEGLGPVGAAYANSAALSALDVDDGHRAAIGHPGAGIIPAVLADRHDGVDTGRLLGAIVVGYEIGVRAAAAQANRDESRMFGSGRWMPIGVAAALGYLRRTPRDVLAQALAIAALHRPVGLPSGASQQPGHVKEGIPWAVVTGFTAANLAGQGFSGSLDVLDIPALFDSGALLAGLGGEPVLKSAYTKPYSCCRWIHAAVDGLLDLMAEHRLGAGQIAAVRVETIGAAARLSNRVAPANFVEAQFSVPFSLAVAAVLGPAPLLALDASLLGRDDLTRFAQRVEVTIDPALDAQFPRKTPARVLLDTTSGRLERFVEYPKGDALNPMTHDAVVAKFRTLSAAQMDEARAAALIAAVEGVADRGIAPVLAALSAAAAAPVAMRAS